MSIGALYEAKTRLRRRGLWPASGTQFVRVQLAPEKATPLRSAVYRISLPNQVVVEVAGGELDAVLSAARLR